MTTPLEGYIIRAKLFMKTGLIYYYYYYHCKTTVCSESIQTHSVFSHSLPPGCIVLMNKVIKLVAQLEVSR